MAHRIGTGVIGMGWMGQVHGRSYRQIPLRFPEADIEPRLVICADDVAARAEQAARAIGFEETTTDWRQLVEHPEVRGRQHRRAQPPACRTRTRRGRSRQAHFLRKAGGAQSRGNR